MTDCAGTDANVCFAGACQCGGTVAGAACVSGSTTPTCQNANQSPADNGNTGATCQVRLNFYLINYKYLECQVPMLILHTLFTIKGHY